MVAHVVLFHYKDISENDRDWLRRRTEDLNTLAYRTVCDLIRVGTLLAEVRARVRKRLFRAWLAAETPVSRATAYRLMAVGQAFGRYVSHSETERITPSALYLLSQPSAPPAARAAAVELAAAGERVTKTCALEILDSCRPVPDLSRAELRKAEAAARELRTRLEPVRAAAAETGPMARVGVAVTTLARAGILFHVSVVADDEEEPLYSVTAHVPREKGAPEVRAAVRRTLVDALEAVLGREEQAVCPTCKVRKPVGEFGRRKRLKTGRCQYCKQCERKRIAALKAARRAQRPAGRRDA